MNEEIIIEQKWVCPKCKRKDRTTYREEPNLRKCLRCGEVLNEDGVFSYKKNLGDKSLFRI